MAISAKQVTELRQKTGAGIMDCKRCLTETDGDVDAAVVLLREKGKATAGKKSARVAAEGRVEVMASEDARIGAVVEINSETDFVARGDDFSNFVKSIASKVLESKPETVEVFEQERKDLVTKIGENVVVRRFGRFDLASDEHGRVETYLHMGGKIGVMVQVNCSSAEAVAKEEFVNFCREMTMHVAAANPTYLNRDEVSSDVMEEEKAIYRKQALDDGKPEQFVDKIVEGRLRKYFGEFCLLEQPNVREQKKSITDMLKELSASLGGEVTIKRFLRLQLGEGIEKKKDDLAEEVRKQVEEAKKG
ncbi:MAG: elongation factor Ts [Deltaproteobacteria bacterium]|nr:elongation factor Ts [Deltaproteobacteria bacterium]